MSLYILLYNEKLQEHVHFGNKIKHYLYLIFLSWVNNKNVSQRGDEEAARNFSAVSIVIEELVVSGIVAFNYHCIAYNRWIVII